MGTKFRPRSTEQINDIPQKSIHDKTKENHERRRESERKHRQARNRREGYYDEKDIWN